MEDGIWFSLALGLATGGIYLLLMYLSLRLARDRSRHSFMMIVFGGMGVRLFVAAATVTLVIVLAPVSEVVYLSTFFCLFLIGLVLEVLVLHRRYASGTGETP